MLYREYKREDLEQILKLFYNTVHTVNALDYSAEQLDAWAPLSQDAAAWNKSLCENYTLVAEQDSLICGFADLVSGGYLNRLYVHSDFQRLGIASQLCSILEKRACGQNIKELTVHASITARPFFAKRGYELIKEQRVTRRGVEMINYVMRLVFIHPYM